jgi:hypothetical protein
MNSIEIKQFVLREREFVLHVVFKHGKFSDAMAFADFLYDHIESAYKGIDLAEQIAPFWDVVSDPIVVKYADLFSVATGYKFIETYCAAWQRQYLARLPRKPPLVA